MIKSIELCGIYFMLSSVSPKIVLSKTSEKILGVVSVTHLSMYFLPS